jgi:outer membrane protein assembly factor BamB
LPAGLEYSDANAKKHSVRGIAWANGKLYVADQVAGTIKFYDITGKYLGQSNQVETPVHIVLHQGQMYVSGGDQVMTSRLPDVPGDFILKPLKGVKVKNASGMAFGNSGNLYVASRTENVIWKFDPDFKAVRFRCELPDNPEFLLHV